MSLRVNFSTHSKNIQDTYRAVLNGDEAVNWVVYGYDKGTNDLKVLAQGDDGLEGLTDEFSDGKIQYAFTRVIDPNTELPKFVFISWCGSGVPESRKGLFNSHLDDVSKFLKGYHVQINARGEADVEPSYIMKRVNESSGSKYSIHKEAPKPMEKPTPVNSVYKKTEIPNIAAMQRAAMQKEPAPAPVNSVYKKTEIPNIAAMQRAAQKEFAPDPVTSYKTEIPDIAAMQRATQKESAPAPVNSVYQRVVTAPKPLASRWGAQQQQHEQEEKERVEREATERATREREERERDQRSRVNQDRQREEQEAAEAKRRDAAAREQARKEAEQAQRRDAADREQARREAEQAQRQREKEEEEEEAQKRWQIEEKEQAQRQRERGEEEAQRRRQNEESEKHKRMQEESMAENSRIEQEQSEREREREEQERLRLEEEQEHLRARLDATAEHAATVAEHVAEALVEPKHTLGVQTALVLFAYDAAEANEMTLLEGEVISNIEQVDDGWWTAVSEDGTRSGLFPANYVQPLEFEEPQQPQSEQVALIAEEEPAVPAADMEDQGNVALALYDYIAAEENEITFHEGDLITQIEFASDDWWQGTAPNGAIGLFPSNYVEMRQ